MIMHEINAPASLRPHPLVFRSFVIALISGCSILFSWLYYQHTENRIISATGQLRHSRVLLQRAEQQLQRLSDAGTVPLTHIVGEDVEHVQIRLAEFLQLYPESDDVSVRAFEQSMLPVSLYTEGAIEHEGALPEFIQILRLTVDVSVSHAPALLALLDELEQTIAGWPVDVRACDIRKTPLSRLNSRCVMDIYYWQADMDK